MKVGGGKRSRRRQTIQDTTAVERRRFVASLRGRAKCLLVEARKSPWREGEESERARLRRRSAPHTLSNPPAALHPSSHLVVRLLHAETVAFTALEKSRTKMVATSEASTSGTHLAS